MRKCQVTIRRKDPANLVHFHLAVSDTGRAHRLRDKVFWSFKGSAPVIVPVAGRGRYMFKALDASHYYCQAPKFGSVFVLSNYPIFTDCSVELNTIFGIWRRYKMDADVAKEQLMKACVPILGVVLSLRPNFPWFQGCVYWADILLRIEPLSATH